MISTEQRLGTRGGSRAVVIKVPSRKGAANVSTVFDVIFAEINLKREYYIKLTDHLPTLGRRSLKINFNQPSSLLRVKNSSLSG